LSIIITFQAKQLQDATLRTILTAVSAWAPKWEFADAINLLSRNQQLVIESNDPESHPAKFLKQFEDKFEFRIFSQWTDNFVCDHVSLNLISLLFYSKFAINQMNIAMFVSSQFEIAVPILCF
jgi:hypothetical protein